MNQNKIPSALCFYSSIGFIFSAIPIIIINPHTSVTSITILIFGGLFFFTLSLIMSLLLKYETLKKRLDDIPDKESRT